MRALACRVAHKHTDSRTHRQYFITYATCMTPVGMRSLRCCCLLQAAPASALKRDSKSDERRRARSELDTTVN
jgi:hypothetical protein